MKKRYYSYDFVRCCAMLGIFWFHFFLTFYHGLGNISVAGANTTLGRQTVTVFFVLSGALSGKGAMREDDRLPFWQRMLLFYQKRWWTIFPAFYLAYLVAMVIGGFAPSYIMTWRFIFTLLGLDGYLESGGIETTYIVGEWFLGCLILLYLATPFLILAIRKHPVVCGVLFSFVYLAAVLYIPMSRPKETSVLVRGFAYIVGIYVELYLRSVTWLFVLPLLALWLVLWFIPVPIPTNLVDLMLGLAAYFILFYVGELIGGERKLPWKQHTDADSSKISHSEQSTVRRHPFDLRRFIRSLAEWSYEVFLLHHIIMLRFSQEYPLQSILSGLKWLLFLFAETVLFAAILHKFVMRIRSC